MKIIKKLLIILLVLFVIAQFFGPEKNDGDLAIDAFISDTNPSQDVAVILKESCYDCHSNATRYPWYNNITPVNYWLAEHVADGKKHFNVTVWDEYSTKKKDHKLEELIEMVEEKEMPLESYTWTHTEAKLTNEQIQSVINWAQAVRIKYGLEAKPE